MAFCSLGLSARLVMRFGLRLPLAVGLLVAACGLALFARVPVNATFVLDVLPGMILFGFGAGIAFNAVLLAAMSDVDPSDSGLASGIVNTSLMMGGALGLAVLASLAAARSDAMQASESATAALNSGYHVARHRQRTTDRARAVSAVAHGLRHRQHDSRADCRSRQGPADWPH